MTSKIPEAVAPFLSAQLVIVYPFTSLLANIEIKVTFFVYGFYAQLFGTYVYMMCSHQQGNERSNHKLYLSLTVVLFALSTVFVVAYTIEEVYDSITRFTAIRSQNYGPLLKYLTGDAEKTALFAFIYLIPVLLNIVAEYMLIHRCYLVWSSKKQIAIALIVASALTNATGVIAAVLPLVMIGYSDSRIINWALIEVGSDISFAYQVTSLTINSVLTLLTAGRIWWIHRQVSAYGIRTTDTFVGSVSRIILESGSLYPILGVVGLVLNNTTVLPFDFYPLLTLSAGIAPTLIMVRGKLGKNVESLQDQVSDIRFPSQSARQPTSIMSQAPVHSVGNPSTAAVEGAMGGGKESIPV
ncbi:hypothetical protein Moror_12100 [Moniliophthora roreri MCA 2997]|uniref:Serpentine receptor class gamma n=1 Tax=Moniliophthora roreri (strain MCA 2997) TaxID=1381753 RepID=V2W9S6_MONRO|nr:hypothetical protein Moror_12100 [Moniliophthora roreri MCA 2997]